MSRRGFCTSIATALPLLPLSMSAFADTQCGPMLSPFGAQNCMSGIESVAMNANYDQQHQNEWCWAACISMVFSYWQHPVTQERIVKETWGGLVDNPGTPQQILENLNRVWVDDNDLKFRAVGDLYTANVITASQDLSQNMPLIICSLGHAMVFTRLDYVRMPNGTGTPQAAYVRDPWPGQGLRILKPQEWYGTAMLIRIRVYPDWA